ncbi:MAG: restriction endonuclease subunit S [Saprospiraceae bacterium]|nr:restriction endonuclease subunit S [Candidatus Defluviibacterium haderslevense]
MKNWEKKKLSDLCDLITKGTTPTSIGYKFTDEGINFIKVESLTESGEIIQNKVAYIDEECHKALKRSQLKVNDILFSIAGALGRIGIVRHEIVPANTNQALAIIRLKNDSNVLVNYLAKYFNSNLIAVEIEKLRGGAAQQNLSLTQLNELEIPIPPLPEQQRIVAILDEVFASILKAKANAEQNLKNAKELFESYLQGVFENPDNNWAKHKLGDVCGFVRGPFGGSLKKNIFKPDGYAVYEQQHAIYDQFDDLRYFIDEKKFNEMKRFELNSGDLIMSCSGTMGKIAIVPENIKKGIINQALLKLSPSKKVSNVFLKLWMQSESFQNSIKEYAGGAAIQNVASVAILKSIEIPLPDISDQRNIVQKVHAFSTETKKLEAIYNQKINDLEELKKSVLQRAFSGELKTEK